MSKMYFLPFRPAFNSAGVTVPGSQHYFTVSDGGSGGNVPSAPFADDALTTPLENPVIANGIGYLPPVYLDEAISYRVRIYDKTAEVGVDTPLEEYAPYVPALAGGDVLASLGGTTGASLIGYLRATTHLSVKDILDLLPLFPEMFGAKGDGTTNDTDAFAAMAAQINTQGGGRVELRGGATYIVGKQTFTTPFVGSGQFLDYTWVPSPIFEISNCTLPVIINGNGANLKAADGLRWGSFDTTTGLPAANADGYTGPGIGAGYGAMIKVTSCSNLVLIENLELDGNKEAATAGGPWGNSGYQVGGDGIQVKNNSGPVRIWGVKSYRHPADGLIVVGAGSLGSPESGLVVGCDLTDNGRNNLSITGGINWTFNGCRFERAGRNLFASAPKGGIDIENEQAAGWVRNIEFNHCVSSDNQSAGLVFGNSSRTSDIRWNGGALIGTVSASYSGSTVPRVHFSRAIIAGQLLGLTIESFEDCLITQDTSLSPTGQIYSATGSITLLPDCRAGNVFRRCRVEFFNPNFTTNGNFNGALFEDCEIHSMAGAGRADLFGYFRGHNKWITETGGTNFARVPGGLAPSTGTAGDSEDYWSNTVNTGTTTTYPATVDKATGKSIFFASVTYDPPSLAAGAKDTIHTLAVTGVVLGDKVTEVSFSNDLAGAVIRAWVSAPGVVSYYAVNENGANPLDLASGTLRVKVQQV